MLGYHRFVRLTPPPPPPPHPNVLQFEHEKYAPPHKRGGPSAKLNGATAMPQYESIPGGTQQPGPPGSDQMAAINAGLQSARTVGTQIVVEKYEELKAMVRYIARPSTSLACTLEAFRLAPHAPQPSPAGHGGWHHVPAALVCGRRGDGGGEEGTNHEPLPRTRHRRTARPRHSTYHRTPRHPHVQNRTASSASSVAAAL